MISQGVPEGVGGGSEVKGVVNMVDVDALKHSFCEGAVVDGRRRKLIWTMKGLALMTTVLLLLLPDGRCSMPGQTPLLARVYAMRKRFPLSRSTLQRRVLTGGTPADT